MTSPVTELKQALRARMLADTALLAHLRGPKIYLDAPGDAAFPYILFLDAVAQDNGTATDEGQIIDIALAVMTSENGSAQAQDIADAIRIALSPMGYGLTGHRLVNLTVRSTVVESVKTGQRTPSRWRAAIRVRAVTEVIEPAQ